MSARSHVRVFRPLRLWVTVVVAAALLAGSATSVAADDSSTSTTTTTLPPAPDGFADSLVANYQAVLGVAQALGQGQGLESLSDYQSQVSGLSDQDLADLYYVSEQNTQWSQIPSLMQTIAADVPGAANLSSKATGPPKMATLMALVRSTGNSPLRHATLVQNTTPVGPFTQAQCDTTDYDAPIFAAQIVLDVAVGVYDGINPFAHSEDPFTAGPVEDVLTVVAAVAVAAASVVHDTLVYLQTLEQNCQGNNTSGFIANIDNTTVATYDLATTLNTSIATITTDVQNIQTQITSFQTTITQALADDTQLLQTTTGSDDQGITTELQIIQSALQNDVTTISSAEKSNDQQVISGATTIQNSISSMLSQILHETDSEAQGLNTFITQENQQILNALQSSATQAQQEYEANLQVLIEQGLAGWAPVVPEVQLMLPAKLGGLLDATPVGVQEVVTSDIQGLQAQGVKVKALAITDLSYANAALAAGNYVGAWSYYAQAYQLAA
jgi:hypothetical protein